MSEPRRLVVGAESILDATRAHIWMLRLKCGHFFYCTSVFKPGMEPPPNVLLVIPPDTTELLPPPKTAECVECGRKLAGLPPKYDPKLPPELAQGLSEHAAKLGTGIHGGTVVAKVTPEGLPGDPPQPPKTRIVTPEVIHPAAGGPPGALGVTAAGVHVVTCPDCLGLEVSCNACGGTGTLPPVLPGRLPSDYVVGFWFACDGTHDNYEVVVCRGPAWIGLVRERRHGTPWVIGTFHPERVRTADQVIEEMTRQQTGHLTNVSLTNHDTVRRWGTFVDVRSNDPVVVERKYRTFLSLVGAHLFPEGLEPL